MSWSSDQGYTPSTIPELMNLVMAGVNAQFSTTYDEETFLGTNFYKYFYAIIQRLQENEVRTSEIVLKLQQYFDVTNEMITRPNTTHPGVIDFFSAQGFRVSTKPPVDVDAGKLYICVDTDEEADDYPLVKKEICELVSQCCVGGVISQGTEVEPITMSNAQAFDYKFNLPTRIPVLLRLTITLSDNNLFVVGTAAESAAKLYANLLARYRLGLDFEPQRYFSVLDAPWAAMVLLEWSDDAGGNWHDEVFDADYDELFTFDLEDISVVEV
jgi:hypothetical protein